METDGRADALVVIETRAAQVTDVQAAERLIELIVMPYERPALVPHNGRMIEEICERGAFAGLDARAHRVRANRDHRLDRVVGAAESFDPDHADGLAAVLRIAQTPLGDETLALAEAGCLDASAGFRPIEARWERGEAVSRRRRIVRAFLAHVALTPEPAYAESRVLSVREAARLGGPALAGLTPNLDRLRGLALEREANLD